MAFFRIVATALIGVVAVASSGFAPAYTNVAFDGVVDQHHTVYHGAVPAATAFTKTVAYGAPAATFVAPVPAVQKTISTTYAAPAAVSKTISYGAVAPVATTVVGAPAATFVAAPAVHKTISYAAAPVQTVVAQPPKTSLHQVVLGNRQRDVRVEEYQRPEQLIRIQEGPQYEPEVVKYAAPAEEPSTVRVINRAAPAPRIEHVVAKQGGLQVYNIEKPANPADRLIHITRGAAPPARVEFYNEGQDGAAEITLSDTPNRPHVEYTGLVGGYSAPVAANTISYGAPVASTFVGAPVPAVQKTISYSAPATTTVVAPAVHKTISYAAPAVQKTISYAAPAVQKTISYAAPATATFVAAPAVQKTISYAAPAVHKTISYAAPTVQKTISYAAPATTVVAAPAVHKTISYAAPATTVVAAPAIAQRTISYSAPATTTVVAAPAVHKTISYAAPAVASVTKTYGAGSFANTYTTTADDFRRAARSL